MKQPIVSIIVAMAANRGIGRNNDLMWHLPEDMKFFKDKTLGHPVIMGRKNYESIPERFRPFKDRLNIVVSSQKDFEVPGCVLVQDLKSAIDVAKEHDEEEVFVIGGGQIYQAALNLNIVDRMYITEVNEIFEDAEVFFPDFVEEEWDKKMIGKHSKDEKNDYDFVIYQYEKII